MKNMPIDRQRFGVSIATLAETMNLSSTTDIFGEKSMANVLAALVYFIPCSIAFNYNLCGQVNAFTNGCAAGIMAIGDAYRLIASGKMDAMVAGGADYSVSKGSQSLMERIGALPDTKKLEDLKPEEMMRPFDEKRYGTVLGDGGAMFVLESLESALARNARIYCEIGGYHANCMGVHASRPDASGASNFKTARAALLEAEVTPGEVDYINAHATAT
jgi:3-oxoacyl-(acyl-carrier-protein) synthase